MKWFCFKILAFLLVLFSCNKKIFQKKQSVALNDYATFHWFKYEGKDSVFNKPIPENYYVNPILAGFYPDPSICTANGKFYLVTSSFSYFPGIPIFESTDLINWKQVGHVITRKEQADFSNQGVSKGMFAPTIRYNNGTFYVICTNVGGIGNFIVTAKKPAGPWSNPIAIPEVNGIDPDIFFDDDGKVYITHNGPPPNNISLHDGHRAIYMLEYDLKNRKVASEPKLLVNGGTDMTKKPVWIEAPHIIKEGRFYYLICAEGGTGYNHSEVVFRSKNVFGPYTSYQNNPILTQRHLPKERKNAITTTGHADFVKLPNGSWWSVFLGCRPYGDDLYNTGRETFLLPVTWNSGWPQIVGGNNAIPVFNKKPNLSPSIEATKPTSGNFTFIDHFKNKNLELEWNFLRTPQEQWHQTGDGFLQLKPRKASINNKSTPSFLGKRQQHQQFEASTRLTYQVTDTMQTAGLVAFQNEEHYLLLGKRLNSNGQAEVYLQKKSSTLNPNNTSIVAKQTLKNNKSDLFLKIEGEKRYYNFYFKTEENQSWQTLAHHVDASILSTKIAGGFVGTYLAMYTSSHHF